jgi:hypothetical protein
MQQQKQAEHVQEIRDKYSRKLNLLKQQDSIIEKVKRLIIYYQLFIIYIYIYIYRV